MKVLIVTKQIRDYPDYRDLIKQSDILKIAVNHAPVKSDYRVFHDYTKWSEYNRERYVERGEKLITVYAGLLAMPNRIWMYYKPVNRPSLDFDYNDVLINYKPGSATDLYFYGGSIVPAMDLATRLGAAQMLIIGDNTAYYDKFQERIKEAVHRIGTYCKIYCFKENNNFGLLYKDLEEFI